MKQRNIPIVLTKPPDYQGVPISGMGDLDKELAKAAKHIFSALEVSNYRLMEVTPNQSHFWVWTGAKDGIELEVRRSEALQTSEYPFWIWVSLENRQGWDGRLPIAAHDIANQLNDLGWNCLVRGFGTALEGDQ